VLPGVDVVLPLFAEDYGTAKLAKLNVAFRNSQFRFYVNYSPGSNFGLVRFGLQMVLPSY
jgi:hypothetical protein